MRCKQHSACQILRILRCDKRWKCLQDEPDTSANLHIWPNHARSAFVSTAQDANESSFSLLQAQKFIAAYSAFLKRQGKLPIPGWVDTVKTSASNELPPQDADWYDYSITPNPPTQATLY